MLFHFTFVVRLWEAYRGFCYCSYANMTALHISMCLTSLFMFEAAPENISFERFCSSAFCLAPDPHHFVTPFSLLLIPLYPQNCTVPGTTSLDIWVNRLLKAKKIVCIVGFTDADKDCFVVVFRPLLVVFRAALVVDRAALVEDRAALVFRAALVVGRAPLVLRAAVAGRAALVFRAALVVDRAALVVFRAALAIDRAALAVFRAALVIDRAALAADRPAFAEETWNSVNSKLNIYFALSSCYTLLKLVYFLMLHSGLCFYFLILHNELRFYLLIFHSGPSLSLFHISQWYLLYFLIFHNGPCVFTSSHFMVAFLFILSYCLVDFVK